MLSVIIFVEVKGNNIRAASPGGGSPNYLMSSASASGTRCLAAAGIAALEDRGQMLTAAIVMKGRS
jgi:hypothetical protein